MKVAKILAASRTAKAASWINWLISERPKKITTQNGSVYKVKGLMGIHVFPDGEVFFLTADDDNKIILFPVDIVDVPMPKKKGGKK